MNIKHKKMFFYERHIFKNICLYLYYSLTVPGYQGTLGATTIASHINPVQAFGMELILCFVMTLTFITDPANPLPTTAILLAANLIAVSKKHTLNNTTYL